MMPNHYPHLIIISSPSGAGKSTLCKMLIANNNNIKLSISATTRKRRQSEVNGQHYFFISPQKFQKMIHDNQFIEYAKVFDYHYGTPKSMIDKEIKKGNSILFDIDWQGARQISQQFTKQEVISFFILPPSMEELHTRLQKRAEDSEEIVLKRMQEAKSEMSHFNEYDYVLINDNLEKTHQRILHIIKNPNQHHSTQQNTKSFINSLLK